jgi:hypothetical protein
MMKQKSHTVSDVGFGFCIVVGETQFKTTGFFAWTTSPVCPDSFGACLEKIEACGRQKCTPLGNCEPSNGTSLHTGS